MSDFKPLLAVILISLFAVIAMPFACGVGAGLMENGYHWVTRK